MTPENISAIADVVIAIGTVALAGVAYWQLSELAAQARIQGERERQWQTIDACWRYIHDPMVVEAKRKIWEARGKGTLPKVPDPRALKQEATFILNFLDGIGVGVQQQVYKEDIVKDYLAEIVLYSVQNLLDGGFGDFAIKREDLGGLLHLYNLFRPDKKPAHTAI